MNEQNKKLTESLDQALSGLWSLVHAATARLSALKEELALSRENEASLAEELKAKEEMLAGLRNTVTVTENFHRQAEDLLAAKEAEVTALKQMMDSSESSIKERDSFISAMETDISLLIDKNDGLKKALEDLESRKETDSEAQLQVREEAEKEIQRLAQLLGEKEALIDEITQKSESAEAKIGSLREEINRREEIISGLKSNYSLELQAAIEERDLMAREAGILGDALAAKTTLMQELESKIGKAIAEPAQAKEAYMLEIAAKDELIAELTRKVQGLSSELTEISSRQPELIKENFELTSAMAKMKSEQEDLLQEIKNYQKIETSLIKKEKEAEKLKEEISALEKKLERSNQQELFSFFDGQGKEEDSLQVKNSELEKLLKTRYEQIEILETDLNELLDQKREEQKMKAELADSLQGYLDKLEKIIEN